MSEMITLSSCNVRAPNVDGISISKATGTAAAATRYAEQLCKEFYEVPYKPLARTDQKVAGHFSSLIDELVFMSSQTSINREGNR